ncbi:claudin-10 [Micropterus salmoides]|uniref:claudin-10 n=1 Tax=Micropterus salmoides TaxID=27706 RepID=UPI0018EBD0F8|nr:claudin-10 [Micropterus salmoides]XP_045910928.1 claudin-10 [Micropterus dolomieu]
MNNRLIQISGFLISSLGWVFVMCTLAMDNWRVAQIGGEGGSFIIKVAWQWSNLWKDCFTDSASITNCRYFPVIWRITPYLQGVQGLLLGGITLGFFGVVLCFVGMECTYIGGADKTKDKVLFAGAVFHCAGGVSDVSGYCLYYNSIVRTTFTQTAGQGILRYELGPPIFVGLVGCLFILLGAVLYTVTVYQVICPESEVVYAHGGGTYMTPRSRGSAYYRPPRLHESYMSSRRSSSSKSSKLSQTTPTKISERDAFV